MDNNGKDTKSSVKLNRKMRMWHKYRNYCFGAAGVLVALVICVAVIRFMGRSSSDNKQQAAVPPTTAQQTTQNETQPVTQAPTVAATEAPTTQPATEATTAAPSNRGILAIDGPAGEADFTSQDYYSDAVLFGDSIIGCIQEYGFLNSAHVVAGNNLTTTKAVAEVDSVAQLNPSKVFIMVGLNDVNFGSKSAEAIAEDLITLAGAVKDSCPSAKVYILSLLPVTSGFEARDTNKITQSAIDDVNDTVSVLAASAGYTYIDVASAYKNGAGYLNPDYSTNGMNLHHDYYAFLLNSIAEVAK